MNEAFSIEEIDREVVELLPDREELLFNINNGNVGSQQAGLVNVNYRTLNLGNVSLF